MPSSTIIGGPYFEDLRIGQEFVDAPAITLTEGLAAQHMAIVGNRFRLALDHELSRRVTGGVIAYPGLVWDLANGQSTLVTQRVIANLFYRGMVFRRFPAIGDTLYTVTTITGLRQNRGRPGRAATGLAVLRIRTVDQHQREVLDYQRCAMIPLRDQSLQTPHQAELPELPSELDGAALRAPLEGWRLDEFRRAAPGLHFNDLVPGTIWEIAGGDVVTSAPELARLTLNIAMTHHDAAVSSAGRLVYGGHTIGIAASHAVRALPNLVTIVGWRGCDHLAPVREGMTLRSTLELEACERLGEGGGLVSLRAKVRGEIDGTSTEVLDWRFVGVMA
ncbi:MAG TPA: MaoC family dehydratase [Candidatus Binataceae bacterium]|jgi:acyl dehydratase|nr:MaoC family dehydratase [Candidatus Binataceae bacterium]